MYLKAQSDARWQKKVSESCAKSPLFTNNLVGYYRRVARKKPLILEVNRLLRLAWAIEYENWTREQWNTIL